MHSCHSGKDVALCHLNAKEARGGCPEQDAIDNLPVLESDHRNLGRQRKENVEIGRHLEVGERTCPDICIFLCSQNYQAKRLQI